MGVKYVAVLSVGLALGIVGQPQASSTTAAEAEPGVRPPTCRGLPVTPTVKVRAAHRFERHFQLPAGTVRWDSGRFARCTNGRVYAAANIGVRPGVRLTERQGVVFQDGGWLFGGTAAHRLQYIGDGADLCHLREFARKGTIVAALARAWPVDCAT